MRTVFLHGDIYIMCRAADGRHSRVCGNVAESNDSAELPHCQGEPLPCALSPTLPFIHSLFLSFFMYLSLSLFLHHPTIH